MEEVCNGWVQDEGFPSFCPTRKGFKAEPQILQCFRKEHKGGSASRGWGGRDLQARHGLWGSKPVGAGLSWILELEGAERRVQEFGSNNTRGGWGGCLMLSRTSWLMTFCND